MNRVEWSPLQFERGSKHATHMCIMHDLLFHQSLRDGNIKKTRFQWCYTVCHTVSNSSFFLLGNRAFFSSFRSRHGVKQLYLLRLTSFSGSRTTTTTTTTTTVIDKCIRTQIHIWFFSLFVYLAFEKKANALRKNINLLFFFSFYDERSTNRDSKFRFYFVFHFSFWWIWIIASKIEKGWLLNLWKNFHNLEMYCATLTNFDPNDDGTDQNIYECWRWN